MIDLETERLQLLKDAPMCIPGRPHISTLFRWWKCGVKGVRLETIVVGGRRFTSVEAIQRFIASLSEASAQISTDQSEQRQRQIAQTDRLLDEDGIN